MVVNPSNPEFQLIYQVTRFIGIGNRYKTDFRHW